MLVVVHYLPTMHPGAMDGGVKFLAGIFPEMFCLELVPVNDGKLCMGARGKDDKGGEGRGGVWCFIASMVNSFLSGTVSPT